MSRTSTTHPIGIAFVDRHLLPTGARLGLTFAPGKKQPNAASGGWDRDLPTDLARLRDHFGTDVLVSLTEQHEHRELGIPDIAAATQAAGMEHIHFPIPDISIPDDEKAFQSLIEHITTDLERARTVVIHCKGGLGRSGTAAAATLVALGEKPGEAIARVRAVRPEAIETKSQEDLVHRYPQHVKGDLRRSRIVGCLLGGAIGDALGAGIEFLSLDVIRERFGPRGVTDYVDAYGRLGAITDDTQMTLFTAEGWLRAFVRSRERGVFSPVSCILHAYLRWLTTQGAQSRHIEDWRQGADTWPDGWLVDVSALHHRRAPGNTCISALESTNGGPATNDSKGCGGIMRSAPIGLLAGVHGFDVFDVAGECSHITHGHPTEHLSSGTFAEIIHLLMSGTGLRAAAEDVLQRRRGQLNDEVRSAVESALEAFDAGGASPERIERLGAGWVSEEALAIGLYCALYGVEAGDFRAGVLLAVNHSGDSDSTGSIAGNLMGAAMGVDALPEAWLAKLELRDVIETVARDVWAAALGRELRWEKYPGW